MKMTLRERAALKQQMIDGVEIKIKDRQERTDKAINELEAVREIKTTSSVPDVKRIEVDLYGLDEKAIIVIWKEGQVDARANDYVKVSVVINLTAGNTGIKNEIRYEDSLRFSDTYRTYREGFEAQEKYALSEIEKLNTVLRGMR